MEVRERGLGRLLLLRLGLQSSFFLAVLLLLDPSLLAVDLKDGLGGGVLEVEGSGGLEINGRATSRMVSSLDKTLLMKWYRCRSLVIS